MNQLNRPTSVLYKPQIRWLTNSLAVVKRNICSTNVTLQDHNHNQHQDANSARKKVKPDLKKAGHIGNSKMIVAACILVCIYMYPMIFKPMFGLGTSAEDQRDMIKRSGLDTSKTRPSNMPDWTSPFGPKDQREE